MWHESGPKPTRGSAGRSIANPGGHVRKRRDAVYNRGMTEPRGTGRITFLVNVAGNFLGAAVAFLYFRMVDPHAAALPRVSLHEVVHPLLVFVALVVLGNWLNNRWVAPINRATQGQPRVRTRSRARPPARAALSLRPGRGHLRGLGRGRPDLGLRHAARDGKTRRAARGRTGRLRDHGARRQRDHRFRLLRQRAHLADAAAPPLPGRRPERGAARAPPGGARPAARHLPARGWCPSRCSAFSRTRVPSTCSTPTRRPPAGSCPACGRRSCSSWVSASSPRWVSPSSRPTASPHR